MAKRRKRRSTRKRKQDDFPGWAWGLWGLAIGLSVAAAVWVSSHRDTLSEQSQPQAQQAASLDNAIDDSMDKNGEAPGAASAADSNEARFTFYDMLPNFEVIIPEKEPDVSRDREPRAVDEPGTYVLQAGSFTAYADADRRRAELALQGIESSIQKVTIDDKSYHRVRIGPTNDLDELNLLRSRLRAAKIDVLRIRLGD